MKKLIVAILALTLVGCAGMTREEQGAMWGALAGITLGILAGDALDCKGCAAIGGAVGGLGGGTLGASWGRELDRLDRQHRSQSLELRPDGHYTQWRNPNDGSVHRVAPVKTYPEAGRYCREFIHEVTIGGKKERAYGKACRKPDGSWEIQ